MFLTKEDILSSLDEREVYQYYYPERIDLRKRYLSPARPDAKRGCYFSYRKNRFVLVDNINGVGYDVFSYVMHTRNISFVSALYTIAKDFNIIEGQSTESTSIANVYKDVPNSLCSFKVINRNFDLYHANYFKQYHLTSNVVKRHTSAVDSYYKICDSSPNKLMYKYTDVNDPCFLYKETIDNKLSVKLYRPLADPFLKWRSSYSTGIAFGYSKLPRGFKQPLIIASSVKDGMCFEQIGIPFIAPSTESALISPDIIIDIKERFYPILIYDIDNTGINSMRKHSSIYDIPHLILDIHKPGIKDAADIAKNFNLNTLKWLTDASNYTQLSKIYLH